MRTVLRPLPVLVSALGAVGLTELVLDWGWLPAIVVVPSAVLIVVVLYITGQAMFRHSPRFAGLLIESGLLLLMIGAAVAGAVLIGLAVRYRPGASSPGRDQEVFAALLAAVANYLGSLIIKPEGEVWNPLKNAIKKTFKDDFRSRRDKIERDARDAVTMNLGYSSQANNGEHVDGWGWWDRRIRVRHLQRAVTAGYLVPVGAGPSSGAQA